VITDAADPDANIIFGAVIDEELAGEIKITVIATGFKGEARKTPQRDTTEEPVEAPADDYSQPVGAASDTADSDELDVPAFIRRKMG
ncbi:MAG: cell division protein FtsZ, partial [Patescibacteria group bacterium]|nr:cell division protein FtsZ [Patescibacteria group bacterium]